MIKKFIWADLSTFDTHSAKTFYSQCFGWDYHDVADGYILCQAQERPAAGLYAMPEKFQRMGMPSFWMSYIHVDGIEELVQVAERHGAKIEVKPQPAPDGGVIALIRDPAGAGFTCYEGADPGGRDDSSDFGRMVWNELHVSDLAKVKPFYASVFGWRIEETDVSGRYEIFASTNHSEPIAGIQITSNEIKGNKEYWGVYFSVNDLSQAATDIKENGGQVVAEQPLGRQQAKLAYDSQGAAFYILENKRSIHSSDEEKEEQTYKWRAILGLLMVGMAVLTEASWVWGLLFIIWVVPDIRHGSTHFLEHVERRRNPVVYWLIIATWIALSIYLLAEAIISA